MVNLYHKLLFFRSNCIPNEGAGLGIMGLADCEIILTAEPEIPINLSRFLCNICVINVS